MGSEELNHLEEEGRAEISNGDLLDRKSDSSVAASSQAHTLKECSMIIFLTWLDEAIHRSRTMAAPLMPAFDNVGFNRNNVEEFSVCCHVGKLRDYQSCSFIGARGLLAVQTCILQ